MASTPRSTRALHLALERISSLFRAQMRETANRYDLKLVQLEAVVYLSVANRYSDSAAALGEYLGLTKGTVSQTIRALEQRGLVRRVADPDDRRVLHCRLTEDGSRIAEDAHPAAFLDDLSAGQQQNALSAALTVLRALQAGRGFRSFGQCRSCRHFKRVGDAQFRCGLTGEPLSLDDSTRICREHQEAEGT